MDKLHLDSIVACPKDEQLQSIHPAIRVPLFSFSDGKIADRKFWLVSIPVNIPGDLKSFWAVIYSAAKPDYPIVGTEEDYTFDWIEQ